MRKLIARCFVVTVAFAAACFVGEAAIAGYGSGGGSSGGYGSSGSGSSGSGSSGGSSGAAYYGAYTGSSGGGSSGGHVGPLRRLHQKVHDHLAAKHARHVARRSSYSGGSSGYYTSGYGSSGSYGGSSGGSSYVIRGSGSSGGGSSGGGSSGGGSSGGHVYSSAYGSSYVPTMTYGSYESSSALGSDLTSSYAVNRIAPSQSAESFSVGSSEIQLMVEVPTNAKVFVNGNATTSQGSMRRFVSRDLGNNETYRFEVQAIYNVDGKEVNQTKTVIAKSGSSEKVVFEGAQSDDPVETTLTLNVPSDATVVLANNPTKSDGTTRVYRTGQLKTGEAWEDYKIAVTHNGITKEKTIRLIGGDKLEMSFNFEDHSANKVASN